jgi:transposase
LVEGHGIPLAVDATPANAPDFKELLPLVESIEPVPGKPSRPKRKPKKLYGDRAYDSEGHRERLRRRGIDPHLAKREAEHGCGLGKVRWVVERFFSWLHGFRNLRLVTEKTQEKQFAFLDLATALICFHFL